MVWNRMRRLPRELLDMVNELLESGHTIDEVTQALRELGADVSRSGVGRYRKRWAEQMKDLAEVREFSRAAVGELKKQPESLLVRLNTEQLEAALFRVVMNAKALQEDNPEKALRLIEKAARAQQLLARARRDGAETTIRADDYAEEKAAAEESQNVDNSFAVRLVDASEERGA